MQNWAKTVLNFGKEQKPQLTVEDLAVKEFQVILKMLNVVSYTSYDVGLISEIKECCDMFETLHLDKAEKRFDV